MRSKIKRKPNGQRGHQFRFRDPVTGTRKKITFWLAEKREAEKALHLFLEGRERKKLGLADGTAWKTPYPELVSRFLKAAPIGSDSRSDDLRGTLERVRTPLALEVAADLCDTERLTLTCKRLAAKENATYVRKRVQQPLKQMTKWAAASSALPLDPLASWPYIPREEKAQKRRSYLPEEVVAILDVVAERDALFARHPLATAYKALLLTGNRPGVVTRTTVGDLDLFEGRIVLPPGSPRKRNGMAYLRREFIDEELMPYLARRGSPGRDEPLFTSAEGHKVDMRNLRKEFMYCLALAAVRLAWPDGEALAEKVTPDDVARYFRRRRPAGANGAPPRDPAKVEKRRLRALAIESLAEVIGSDVERVLDRHDMYALRKTHITWARRFVNVDSVHVQVGHGADDIEEEHYVDPELVDAAASAEAVWDVLLGRKVLTRSRRRAAPLRLAVGADSRLGAADARGVVPNWTVPLRPSAGAARGR